MAVACECMNIFVRFDSLARALPGGASALSDPTQTWGYHDGQIVRLGAMDPYREAMLVQELEKMGLKAGRDFGGFDVPWLEISSDYPYTAVELKGKPNGILINAGNFDDFLTGRLRPKRMRATAVVQVEGKTLLVRDKMAHRFSLPGGAPKRNEPALAAAIRELKEELGLTASQAERIRDADYDGQGNRHLVCKLTLSEAEDVRLNTSELAEYCWWDGFQAIPVYPHVRKILLNLG